MTKIVVSAWLMLKLAFRGLEIDRDFLLVMWRNQPAIEIYESGAATHSLLLEARIDAIFPF